MSSRKSSRSRKSAPGAARSDSLLSLARQAAPTRLHAHAKLLAADRRDGAKKLAPHPLTEALLARHAATLHEPAPDDADVLFHDPSSEHPRELLVQVRKGRVARVLVRA